MAAEGAGWSGVGWDGWADLDLIRARLDAGADPNADVPFHGRPLHAAAERGTPEVIAELAGRVDDVDAEHDGRTALWEAVFARRPDNAGALVAAGADPWRPMMAGWSPGRLSLASPTPDLFDIPTGQAGLAVAEVAAVAKARRSIAPLGDLEYYGTGLACVADISVVEVARPLQATSADDEEVDEIMEDPWSGTTESLTIVGVTEVSGGCTITQPWGFAPYTSRITKRVSVGTVCYAMYANPKSGNQGSVTRDGVVEEWDTHPGGGSTSSDEPAEHILSAYLYHGEPIAYCCASAGLQLRSVRAIAGPPDAWLKLPEQNHGT